MPITLASKLAGRVGEYELGVTHALLDNGDSLGDNVLAARVSRKVLEQSSVGMIATAGDPNSINDSYLLGGDFRYRISNFLEDKTLTANVFALGNWIDGEGKTSSDYAYGVNVSYQNDIVWASSKYLEIGDAFSPSLGFVRRKGVRAFANYISLKHRPEDSTWYRDVRTSYSNEFFFKLDGSLDSGEHAWTLFNMELASADEVSFRLQNDIDHPSEDFEIVDGNVIPAGDYSWNSGRLMLELAGKRPVWGELGVQSGEFYDGWRTRYFAELQWNPNRHFGFGMDYQLNDVDLDSGDFEAHVAAVTLDWNFTPDLSWSNIAQYDSISDTVGFNSRIRWEYRPGSTAYLVFNQSYIEDHRRLHSVASDATLKVGMNFRF